MAWLALRGRKMKFKNVIHILVCVLICIYLYMCGSNEANASYI